MMKKILISIIIMFSLAAKAMAEPDVKLRIGLQAGYNMTKWNADFKKSYGASFKNGFAAGAAFEIMLNQKWSIQPSLFLCMEGTKFDSIPQNGVWQGKTTAGAVGIKFPVDVMYSIMNVGPGRLVPSLGLYVTGYTGGKTLDSETFGKESVFEANWAEDKNQPKVLIPDNFDYGMSFKMMYEWLKEPIGGLYVQAGVSRGFTHCQNMCIMATVGYKFQYVKALRSTYNTGIFEYNP